MSEEERTVRNIENGTVIDHISPGSALKCLKIINPRTSHPFFIGMNVPSKKISKKDFIKLEEVYLNPDQTDKIALLAPNATINTVKKFKVISKRDVAIPKEITGTLRCLNPKCASNEENYVCSAFAVKSENPLILKCKYCGRHLLEEDLHNQL